MPAVMNNGKNEKNSIFLVLGNSFDERINVNIINQTLEFVQMLDNIRQVVINNELPKQLGIVLNEHMPEAVFIQVTSDTYVNAFLEFSKYVEVYAADQVYANTYNMPNLYNWTSYDESEANYKRELATEDYKNKAFKVANRFIEQREEAEKEVDDEQF